MQIEDSYDTPDRQTGFLRSLIGNVVWEFLGPLFAKVPVHNWPAWTGDAFDIKVPNNVRVKSVPSPAGGANINIVLTLLQTAIAAEGDIAECGVFRGSTLLPLGLYLAQNRISKRVEGLDSFAGFDDTVQIDIGLGGAPDAEKRTSGFNQTSIGYVSRRLAALRLQGRVELVQGFFADTLPTLRPTRYCFVHLDCDIYASYKTTLAYFYDRMSPGGIILFDEYNDPPWPGCNKAIDEFLADRPERPQLIERDGYEKYFIVKE